MVSHSPLEGGRARVILSPAGAKDLLLPERRAGPEHMDVLQVPTGTSSHTPVVLGQPGDAEALLGVVTLEILGLVFDPFRRTLHPMRALLV